MAWHQAPVHFLHTFGYIAHVKNASKHLAKLVDRSNPMVFMGYEPGTKAYHFYDPATMRICISRDAVFEEDTLGIGARRRETGRTTTLSRSRWIPSRS